MRLAQVEYSVLVGKDAKQETPVASCIDFTTGVAGSCVASEKVVEDYPIAELQRLVMQCGRSQGVLQTEQDTSIRALARGLATYTGQVVQEAPAYSESQGSIKRYHATLREQVRTLHKAAKDNYGGFDIQAYAGLKVWLAKHAT